MIRPAPATLLLCTPYLAAANNGNWRTAVRWKRLLASYRVIVQSPEAALVGAGRERAAGLIALHARRSRTAIAGWRTLHPSRALIVVLTGTDLYKDLPAGDADVRSAIMQAQRLIVLQEDAPAYLPPACRTRTDVVFQSARTLKPAAKPRDRLRCVLVAHLRAEKDPATVFAAWRGLPAKLPVTLTIVGEALDPELGDAARQLAADDKRVRWVGPKPHAWTRQAIRRAHLLLCPSRMEGGANVVVEAVTAGTPVLASRMSGNVGMLGCDYPGYFPVGAADALTRLLLRSLQEPGFLGMLEAAVVRRAPRFNPAAERASLMAAIGRALAAATDAGGEV